MNYLPLIARIGTVTLIGCVSLVGLGGRGAVEADVSGADRCDGGDDERCRGSGPAS